MMSEVPSATWLVATTAKVMENAELLIMVWVWPSTVPEVRIIPVMAAAGATSVTGKVIAIVPLEMGAEDVLTLSAYPLVKVCRLTNDVGTDAEGKTP